MSTHKVTAAQAAKMTDEEIVKAQEKIDKERLAIKEHGKVLKEEIQKRRMEEVLVAKLKNNQGLTQAQEEYLQKMGKEGREDLKERAMKQVAESMMKKK